MRAVILVGHGSLRRGSGAAMIRLAARAREAGVAPIVAAGFLNYSRPAFAEVLARCVARGADEVVVVPYFLVPGVFVNQALPRLLGVSRAAHPGLRLLLAPPFGDHPALAGLVCKRSVAAQRTGEGTALLLIAHGSPDSSANQPIEAVAARIRATETYATVLVSYLGLNEPPVGPAIDTLVQQGARRIVAVPYFLQLGGHVAEDLPLLIAAARARHPHTPIVLAEHLAYDPLLVPLIADRAAEASYEL